MSRWPVARRRCAGWTRTAGRRAGGLAEGRRRVLGRLGRKQAAQAGVDPRRRARRRRRTILTVGALATNHGLATALYAREHGIRTVLALVDQPLDEHVRGSSSGSSARAQSVYRTHGFGRSPAAAYLRRHTDLRRCARRTSSRSAAPRRWAASASWRRPRAGRAGRARRAAGARAGRGRLGSGGTAAGLALGLASRGSHACGGRAGERRTLSPGHVARLAERARCSRGAAPAPRCADSPADVRVETRGWGTATATGPPRPTARRPCPTRRGWSWIPSTRPRRWRRCSRYGNAGSAGRGPVLYWHTHNALAG